MRTLSDDPAGFGVGWTDHVSPFQRSTNTRVFPDPTAVHAVAEVHDTAISTLEGRAGPRNG